MNSNLSNEFCKCAKCFEKKLHQLHFIINYTETKLQNLLSQIQTLNHQLNLFPNMMNYPQQSQSQTYNYTPMEPHATIQHQYETPNLQ